MNVFVVEEGTCFGVRPAGDDVEVLFDPVLFDNDATEWFRVSKGFVVVYIRVCDVWRRRMRVSGDEGTERGK